MVLACLFALAIVLVLADTPASCREDQYLGTWEFVYAMHKATIVNDRVDCPYSHPDDFVTRLGVTLHQHGLALTEGGVPGTWFSVANQGIQVSVTDLVFFIFTRYEQELHNSTHIRTTSYCGDSMPKMAWATVQGARTNSFHCLTAKLLYAVNPTVNERFSPVTKETAASHALPHANFISKETIIVNGRPYTLIDREEHIPTALFRNDTPTDYRKYSGRYLFAGNELPANYTWQNVRGRRYVPLVYDQGHCGSCYIVGTLQTMMARVMVSSNLTDRLGRYDFLSVQHVLDCNMYGQGCDGGFGEEVSKFSSDFGILLARDYQTGGSPVPVDPSIMPQEAFDYPPFYSAKQLPCAADSVDPPERKNTLVDGVSQGKRRYHFGGYGYLGGYLGGDNHVQSIMWEIYRYGPVAVSIFVNKAFRECMRVNNESIAFTPLPEDFTQGDTRKSRHFYYKRSNHLISLVGWGEDSEGPYWVVMNSWGKDWCNEGFVKIRRGTNEYNIEAAVNLMYWIPDVHVTVEGPDTMEMSIVGYSTLLGCVIVISVAFVVVTVLLIYLRVKIQRLLSPSNERLWYGEKQGESETDELVGNSQTESA